VPKTFIADELRNIQGCRFATTANRSVVSCGMHSAGTRTSELATAQRCSARDRRAAGFRRQRYPAQGPANLADIGIDNDGPSSFARRATKGFAASRILGE
jgi:hypothetical protein